MFKTSLFLSPQVLAIVIRSHIFHMHLVTLLLKDKTTHYFSPGSRSAITTTIYCKNITNNGEVMKYLMVSYVWRITLTPLSVQLLLRPNLHSSVFMKSSLTIPTLSYALISIVHFSNSPWVKTQAPLHCQVCLCPTLDCKSYYIVGPLWHDHALHLLCTPLV